MEQSVETVIVNQPRGELKAHAGVECKLPVPASGVYRVLSAVARAVETAGEGQEGEVRYRGKVLFSVTFSDGEGRIHKTECGVEFSGAEPCAFATPKTGVETQTHVEGVHFRIAGETLYLTATAVLNFRLSESAQHTHVTCLPNAHTLVEEEKFLWKIKDVFGEMELEEEWEEPTAVADILTFTPSAYVKNAQAGVGVISAEGTTQVHLIVKPTEGGVYGLTKTFPFRVETEEGDCVPSCAVRLSVSVENVRFSVVTDPDKNRGTVTVCYTLRFSGALYGERKISLLKDCFSENQGLTLLTGQGEYETLQENLFRSGVEVGETARALAVLPYGATALSLTPYGGGITAEGVLSISVFYAEEGAVKAADADIPFSLNIKCENPHGADWKVSFGVESVGADFVGAKELSVTAILSVCLTATKNQTFTYVKEVAEGEEKVLSNAAVSLYFAKKGESAWELAKRLSIAPERIALTNPELTYPLTGKERIVIYRQKEKGE